jgi:FkbM family methyltransferase
MACEQGVYEQKLVSAICSVISRKPGSWYLDIGSNIGLTSIPILHNCPDSTVVSVEVSPNTLPYLNHTVKESGYDKRWKVVSKAVGKSTGSLTFNIASQAGFDGYEGFENTNRAGVMNEVTVPVTTIDTEWELMGMPSVSCIKVDIEGAELYAIEGALKCIEKEKPWIFLELFMANIKAYDLEPEAILILANSINYRVCSFPDFLLIIDPNMLKIKMLSTDTFVLLPHSFEPQNILIL